MKVGESLEKGWRKFGEGVEKVTGCLFFVTVHEE
jgi:hypothetical protein